MTAYRQSMIYALESTYGAGPGANSFISPPPNTFFTSTHTRSTSIYYAEGTKNWEVVTYGQMQGSWSWSFILDYEYPEPLALFFDSVVTTSTSSGKKIEFSKSSTKRVPSFCVQRKILNNVAGGPSGKDETVVLKGCVARDITFNRSGAGAQIVVSMSGFYADEEMTLSSLTATDYASYTGDPVEYACLMIGSEDVAYTEQISISISNNASPIYSVCSPFAQNYYEGPTSYRFGTTAYSNNPERYKRRLYSGGKDNRHLKPMGKDLAPVPEMSIKCYTYSDHNDPTIDAIVTGKDTSVDTSSKSITFTMTDVIIKSLTWEKGDGQKLMDTISSADVKKIKIVLINQAKNDSLNLSTGGWHPKTRGAETRGDIGNGEGLQVEGDDRSE